MLGDPCPGGPCSASCRDDGCRWGIGLRAFSSTSLPAVGSCQHPASCWGQPCSWERASGAGLGVGCCFTPQLRSLLPPGAAVAAGSVSCGCPWGPTARGWQLLVGWPRTPGRLPAPSGPSCSPTGGSRHSSPPGGVSPGSLKRHGAVPGSPGPCQPPRLSLAVALPCPSRLPKRGDRGRTWDARPCCGPSPSGGGAGKGQTVWLGRGSLVTLPAAFPAGLWPRSRCHVGDKGTLDPGSSRRPGGLTASSRRREDLHRWP